MYGDSLALIYADSLFSRQRFEVSLNVYLNVYGNNHTALDAEQMRRIAWIYEIGNGLNKRPEQAFIWYKRAAEAGNLLAMGKLGNYYYNGVEGIVSVKKDSAFYWYMMGAKNGDSIAMYNVGVMYNNGDGVKKSKGSADTWLKKAYDHGIKEAREFLQ
jgi:TPR repeat protein